MDKDEELNKIIKSLFNNIKDYQDVLVSLEKLENYFNENNIELTTSLVVKLFHDNEVLLNCFDLLYNKYYDEIKNKELDKISKNYFLRKFLRVYCILKEVEVELEKNNNSVLTYEEEIIIIKKIRKGDMEAKAFLMQKNIPLVLSIAQKYSNNSMSTADLFQEGCFGLMHAIDKYDETQGVKFSSYATPWIIQAVLRGKYSKDRTIKLPIRIREGVHRYYVVYNTLHKELNREPTLDEISKAMNIPVSELKKLIYYSSDTVSLDFPSYDENSTLGDLIVDDTMLSTEEKVIENVLKEEIQRLLFNCGLDVIELEVLTLMNGLFDNEVHSLREISSMLGFSVEKIRQTEIRAISKIIKSKEIEMMLSYADSPEKALENIMYLREKYTGCNNRTKSLQKILSEKNIH